MSFLPELDGLMLDQLIERFQNPAPYRPDDIEPQLYYQEVAIAIRRTGANGNRFLTETLAATGTIDKERLVGLFLALGFPADVSLDPEQRDYAVTRMKAHLADDEPLVVAEAIRGLQGLREPIGLEQTRYLLSHPFYLVRANTIVYVANVRPQDAFPILIAALTDKSHWVREESAEQLGSLGNRDAVPYLRTLLNDTDEYVRSAAQESLDLLAMDGGGTE